MFRNQTGRGTAPGETPSAAAEEADYHHWDAAGTIPESSRSGWTDEKHSMYLQSMETSFIQDLYNKDYSLNELLGWSPQAQKEMDLLTSNGNDLHPDQFKVHGKGCWRTLKFEKASKQGHTGKEFAKLSTNPWIRHFGSPSSNKGVHPVQFAGQLPSYVDNYHQESIGSNTEVSDQNFVDSSGGAKERGKTCKKRRTKNGVRGPTGKDQVVP